LAAGIAYLSCQGWRQANEWKWLARAKQLPEGSNERADALQKAFTAEPMNFLTAHNIGEVYRAQSFASVENYEAVARQAMQWYERSMKLNPYDAPDAQNHLRYAMCLDWLDRHTESEPYFNRADALDPNSYYVAANIGWHYFQIRDYAAARVWLERSLRLERQKNLTAQSYQVFTRQRLTESASDKNPWPADYYR
jgi:tetratricopeptide (TPR) repeat protein